MTRLRPHLLVCILSCLVCNVSMSAEKLIGLRTDALPELPASASGSVLVAVGDELVALGMNGGWILNRGAPVWRALEGTMPGPVVAAAARARGGVVALVGDPRDGGTARSLVSLVLTGSVVQTTPVSDLPESLASPRLAMWGETVHVGGRSPAGGQVVYAYPMSGAAPAWSRLPDLPADVDRIEGLVVQDLALFAFLRVRDDPVTRLRRWTPEEGWGERHALADGVLAGTLRSVGQAHILVVGTEVLSGAEAQHFHAYHTITDVWTVLGDIDTGGAVRGAAWKNGVALVGPESEGGTQVVLTAEIEMKKRLIHFADWSVIVLYLAGMAGVGLFCYLREKRHTTADYFVGGRSIPFWAAGLSLYATGTSAISYIAIPAKSFATNWLYLAQNVVGLLATVFVAIWIVPLIRKLNVMSVYHYLEMRFNPAIRMFASGICIVLQLGGRMSVVLFLPSLAISTVTGLHVVWSIVIMGGITIVYTVMGGMKAVIWTDVIQVFVMLGGAFFAIGYVVLKLDGGFSEFMATSAADQKMRMFDWSWDLTKATVWGFIFLSVLDVITYPKDQVMMQRVLSTKSAKAAGLSVWTLAAVVVPGSLTFYAIGTALYAFYKHHPEKMNPLLTVDATFPHFIAAELPVGVTGLIIAGIFAASMSTLSSCMNSVATLVSVDFYEKIARKPDPKTSVRIAEGLTIVAGVIGVGTAILISFFDIGSVFDLSLELAGLLGGGFAGTYALGIFTRRANWQGAAIGISVSIVVTLAAWSVRLVHSFFYSAVAIFTCIVVGYIASLFFPAPSQSLEGLTIVRRLKDTTQTPS